nr:unnamed protein product [Digitaria exilis]
MIGYLLSSNLTGGDALERVVGADGVEVDAGEVERAAAPAGGGEEEAEQPAPVAAVHLQHRRRVHGCPPRPRVCGEGGIGPGGEAGRARRLGWPCDCDCGVRAKSAEGQGFGAVKKQEGRPHA